MKVILTEVHEIPDLINLILGEKSPLVFTDDAWDLKTIPDGSYVTRLSNAAGEVRGAVLTDINATVFLGGKLVMMPEAGLCERAKNLEVDDSIVEALAEIVNMMRSIFNKQFGNEHMSPQPTQPMVAIAAEGDDTWMLEPASRIDLTGDCSFGKLCMSIVFR
jgi:hypothetical protein